MIPTTPRGFRDCLPTEAAWRQAVDRRVRDSFAAWGYLPIETPTLERLEVLLGEGERRVEIVVEAGLDRGADGQLDLGVQALDGLSSSSAAPAPWQMPRSSACSSTP